MIAAKRLGAEQIIIMGRHADRIALAREFGATDVVSERGEEAIERVRELTGGSRRALGARVRRHRATRCATAVAIARPGGAVGRVGVPHYEAIPPRSAVLQERHRRRRAGARARAYIDELLPDVLEGRIEPGRVFDRSVGLDGVPDGYRAMNERESIKVMVDPS